MKKVFTILLMMLATQVYATNATWIGSVDTNWATIGNWTTNPVPGETTNDIATFSNGGNGNTNIYTGAIALQGFQWSSSTCAAYTVTGGPLYLNWINVSDFYMLSTVTSNQTINVSTIYIVTNAAAGQIYFRNDSASGAKLIVNSPITGGTGGTAGAKTLNMQGNGEIYLGGQLTKGGGSTFTLNMTVLTGTCHITYIGTNYITTLNMNAANKKIDLGTSTLSVSNGGAQVIGGGQSSAITNGTIRIDSTGGGANYADFGVTIGNILTVYSTIAGNNGIDFYSGSSGTTVLRGTNTYTGPTEIERQIVVVDHINNAGVPGGLGTNGIIRIGATGQTYNDMLRYDGTGETNNRTYELQGGANDIQTIDHSGTGTFKLTGVVRKTQSGNNTLRLTSGVTSNTGEIAVIISDFSSTGRISILKTNIGTWVLSGINTYSGFTAVNGGTLSITSVGSISKSTNITVLAGATLEISSKADVIGDTTPVSLDGMMNLSNGVIEVVGSLFLGGGKQLLEGTYGSSVSSARYTNDTYFAGTGIIVAGSALRIIPSSTSKLWELDILK